MIMRIRLVILSIFINVSLCRDFYVGMFKKNDLLVAQDTVYKERHNYGFTTAKYGRLFNCPITYFRVVDRLGVGRPPRVQITRGGLQKKYLTLLLTSSYNQPIAVNIYVGCENKLTTQKTTITTIRVAMTTTPAGTVESITASIDAGAENVTEAGADVAASDTPTQPGDVPTVADEKDTPAEEKDVPAQAEEPTPAEEVSPTPTEESSPSK